MAADLSPARAKAIRSEIQAARVADLALRCADIAKKEGKDAALVAVEAGIKRAPAAATPIVESVALALPAHASEIRAATGQNKPEKPEKPNKYGSPGHPEHPDVPPGPPSNRPPNPKNGK